MDELQEKRKSRIQTLAIIIFSLAVLVPTIIVFVFNNYLGDLERDMLSNLYFMAPVVIGLLGMILLVFRGQD